MKIVTLVENTSISDEYEHRHGLSFYIETKDHKILCDVGPDSTFLENAKKLNVDIADVDTVIITHGHYDHGGGLKTFLDNNDKVNIYISKDAFGKFFARKGSKLDYIGIDGDLKKVKRFILVDGDYKIDDNLYLASNIDERILLPESNKYLIRETKFGTDLDDFAHEQNLIIQEDNKKVLIGGCAHKGIVNILNKVERDFGIMDYVISGFHLENPFKEGDADEDIQKVGDALKGYENTKFYTCHCTGLDAYNILKDLLGDKINYICAGTVLNI